MKRIITLIIAIFLAFQVDAQVKFGIMTGKSPNHISTGEIEYTDNVDSLRININSANAPWLLGPYLRLQRGSFFLQGGLLLGFSTLDYELDSLFVIDDLITIRDYEWHLDIPIEIGYLFFDDRVFVKVGVLGSNYFQHEKENAFLAFDEKFADIFRNRNFGYRVGAGFDLENSTTISLSYTNFQNIQNSVVVYNKIDYDFEFREHQIMVNFSWNFIRD